MSPRLERALLLGLLLLVTLVYLPSLGFAPLDWDDPVWLEDPLLGLSLPDALRTAFTTPHDHVWTPLLRLSHWLQHQAFADRSGPRHAVNLALFLGSIAVLYRLLRTLSVPAWPALAALAVWALHPSRIESVVWLTGLKDVQSLLLLALGALYLVREDPKIPLGTALGAAGLLTKSAMFPVPFALAAVLWLRQRPVRPVLPLCAAALLLAAVGRLAWGSHGWPDMPRALLPLWVHGVFWRTLLDPTPPAVVALPQDPVPVALAGALATASFALAAWRWPRVAGPLLVVWLLPQLPFLGLVPMAFWGASRHLLVPMLGLTVALALGLDAALARGPAPARMVPLLLLCWPWATWRREADWRSSRALWESEVARRDEHWVRWMKVGTTRGIDGEFASAVEAFDRALALEPDPDTLARRLIAALAADGWTPQDAALARRLQPPPDGAAAWLEVVEALRVAGEEELAQVAERTLRKAR
jgi:hypothetical protein